MVTHFQVKELANNFIRREWAFSFYSKNQFIHGIYFKNGDIEWKGSLTSEQKKKLEPMIHELMLYHVYEQ